MNRDRNTPQNREEIPPNSRLFIIGPKQLTEEHFRSAFSKFGNIEEIWVVKDKYTGENKGVTYIKFAKTSEAANALEEMNGAVIGDCNRHIKVVIAASREQGSKRENNEDEKAQRLFVLVPKSMTTIQLKDYFQQFGTVDYVNIVKDKETKESKGFAYVKYLKFSHAAEAFEKCERSFKPVFAEPRRYTTAGSNTNSHNSSQDRYNINSDFNLSTDRLFMQRDHNDLFISNKLRVISSAVVNEDQLWKLFDIIPGLDYCQLRVDHRAGRGVAQVSYVNAEQAAYACEKLHGFEYPPGFRLIVKSDEDIDVISKGTIVRNQSHLVSSRRNNPPSNLRQLAETLAQATSLIKNATMPGPSMNSSGFDSICNISLPERKPLADVDAESKARCFIVFTPPPPSLTILRDVFCRFGNLIEIYLLSNRNCGYARYAATESAEEAIRVLHGAEICGGRIKVMEAEERDNPMRKRKKLGDGEQSNY